MSCDIGESSRKILIRTASFTTQFDDVIIKVKEIREGDAEGGADVVLEVAGAENTFELARKCARPNAIVTVVALYDKVQTLPLPDMYGKNLTFKTGALTAATARKR